ncbi:MAG: hypothetical protein J6A29_03290 [Clostridia bacterium]|nr:hypothetical protein [Clostridia bacterium]
MNLKQNKGIGAADAIIAVAILVIFTGIIVSISYNIYNQSNFIKRNEQATKYIVELFEYAQGIIYEDLNSQVMIDYINNKYENTKAIKGKYIEGAEKQAAYTIFINVTDEYPDNVTDEYLDCVKKIDITVMYKLGGKNKTVNMKTLINK